MRDHVRICGSPGGAIPGPTRPCHTTFAAGTTFIVDGQECPSTPLRTLVAAFARMRVGFAKSARVLANAATKNHLFSRGQILNGVAPHPQIVRGMILEYRIA